MILVYDPVYQGIKYDIFVNEDYIEENLIGLDVLDFTSDKQN